jgi:glycosyltransferase involved in cell wall biosynthesis
MPLLRQGNSGVRFAIVGRSPSAKVASLAADDIDVVGPVVDERPWLAGAAAYVVPLRSGGGMRFKVVQAMASGVPVITTRFGASGVTATCEHVTFAETAGEFAAGIRSVLEDPRDAARRVMAARDLAVCTYDWRRIVPALDAIYGQPVEIVAR